MKTLLRFSQWVMVVLAIMIGIGGCQKSPVTEVPPLSTLSPTPLPVETILPLPTPSPTLAPIPQGKYPAAPKVDALIKGRKVVAGPSERIAYSLTDGQNVFWGEYAELERDTLWTGWETPEKIFHGGVNKALEFLAIDKQGRVYFWEYDMNINVIGYRLYRFDPATDTVELIEERPDQKIDEDHVYYTRRAIATERFLVWPVSEGRDICIRVYEFETGTFQNVECISEQNQYRYGIYDATLSWPWLYYAYQEENAEDSTYCHLARKVNLETGERWEWGRETCAIWQVAGNGTWDIWSEIPLRFNNPDASVDYDKALMFGRDAEGKIWELGYGSAGSMRMCQNRVYWVYRGSDNEIRSWTSGEPVKVMYRSSYLTSGPLCVGQGLSLQRALIERNQVGSPDEVFYLPLP